MFLCVQFTYYLKLHRVANKSQCRVHACTPYTPGLQLYLLMDVINIRLWNGYSLLLAAIGLMEIKWRLLKNLFYCSFGRDFLTFHIKQQLWKLIRCYMKVRKYVRRFCFNLNWHSFSG